MRAASLIGGSTIPLYKVLFAEKIRRVSVVTLQLSCSLPASKPARFTPAGCAF